MLRQHSEFGPPYGQQDGIGMHSGYNEVVLDGTHWVEEGLPHAIEAFFELAHTPSARLLEAHRQFLSTYHLTSAEVPLLMLQPKNWETPFSLAL